METAMFRAILVFIAIGLMASTALAETTCIPTSADTMGASYIPDAIEDRDIAPEEELNDKSQEIVLHGKVLDEKCEDIIGAKVEVWYAGGPQADFSYPPGDLWYRGQTFTDEDGYSFHATYPATFLPRPIPHIYFKVTKQPSGEEFVTQLYFRDDVPASYEDYVKDRDTQFPQLVKKQPDGSRKIQFDIVIDPNQIQIVPEFLDYFVADPGLPPLPFLPPVDDNETVPLPPLTFENDEGVEQEEK